MAVLLVLTRTALALDNDVDSTPAVSSRRGSCRGLCCQSKNNTCSGVVDDDEKKQIATRCFCDAACLELGDCCDDYVQSCQREYYMHHTCYAALQGRRSHRSWGVMTPHFSRQRGTGGHNLGIFH